jgi:hypothetical protein
MDSFLKKLSIFLKKKILSLAVSLSLSLSCSTVSAHDHHASGVPSGEQLHRPPPLNPTVSISQSLSPNVSLSLYFFLSKKAHRSATTFGRPPQPAQRYSSLSLSLSSVPCLSRPKTPGSHSFIFIFFSKNAGTHIAYIDQSTVSNFFIFVLNLFMPAM